MLVGMPADPLLLVQLLTLAGLTAGTAEYSAIIRRRVERQRLAERRLVEATGLQGLVRVLLADA